MVLAISVTVNTLLLIVKPFVKVSSAKLIVVPIKPSISFAFANSAWIAGAAFATTTTWASPAYTSCGPTSFVPSELGVASFVYITLHPSTPNPPTVSVFTSASVGVVSPAFVTAPSSLLIAKASWAFSKTGAFGISISLSSEQAANPHSTNDKRMYFLNLIV